MSINPNHYLMLTNKYNVLQPKVNQILSERNPISFPKENLEILQQLNTLAYEIQIGINELKEGSDVKPTYENMLCDIQTLQQNLANFCNGLYRR